MSIHLDLDDHAVIVCVENESPRIRDVAEATGFGEGKCRRILHKLRDLGLVRHKNHGRDSQWWELTPIAEAIWGVAELHFEEVYRDA